ncbi:MAG TPA: PEP-CTERM sorting domain-containing protein [Nostocaceae cyanobacterium]|nr:PEP-CTERM sorting domain-containing protein [Nostocaceae cyanobacterium]
MATVSTLKKLSIAVVGATVASTIMSINPAQAAVFDLKWSGESFGNGASATGFIEFDPSDPSFVSATIPPSSDITSSVKDFSITITGARSGNGTFTLSDFQRIIFRYPPNSSLDFTQELVGQPANPPALPFGTAYNGQAGDFNIFRNFASSPNAPTGAFFFQIITSGSTGDRLKLTSFKPQTTVPEPASLIGILGLGTFGLTSLRKRKQKPAA